MSNHMQAFLLGLFTFLLVGSINVVLFGYELTRPEVPMRDGGFGPRTVRLTPPWLRDTIHGLNFGGVLITACLGETEKRGDEIATWWPDLMVMTWGTVVWTALVPSLALGVASLLKPKPDTAAAKPTANIWLPTDDSEERAG
jgi:hypothetical protein